MWLYTHTHTNKIKTVGADDPVRPKHGKQTGITLIALVITIIIMLILAGVTIAVVINGGLFGKTTEAVAKTKEEAGREIVNLTVVNMQADNYADKKGKLTLEDIRDNIAIYNSEIEAQEIVATKLEVEYNGYIYEITGDLQVKYIGKATIAIEFSQNGEQGVTIAKTIVTTENINGQVQEGSLRYKWSETNSERPEEPWTEFTSGDELTKTITGQEIWYLWVRAEDEEGIERVKVSNPFNNTDETVPTINLTCNMAELKILAEVDYGFAGVARVAWLEGNNKGITDFEGNKGTTLTSESKTYTLEVNKATWYTIYIRGNNGKEAIEEIHADFEDGQIVTFDINKGIIPEMTSNTTPTGYVASASSIWIADQPEWKAFNHNVTDYLSIWHANTPERVGAWLAMKLPEPEVISYFTFTNRSYFGGITQFKLQVSNDGNIWTDLKNCTTIPSADIITRIYTVSSSEAYMYYRIYVTATNDYVSIQEFQIYKSLEEWL